MASPKLDRDRAAKALVDAELSDDKTACQRHEITQRTLERYRSRLTSDRELSGLYQSLLAQRTVQMQAKRERGELRWRLETQKALATIAMRVAELAKTCTDIDMLRKAFSSLGEPEYTSEMLNGGTASEDRSQATPDRGSSDGEDDPEADNPPIN